MNEAGVSDNKIATEKKDDSKFQSLASKIVDEALKNNNDDLLATVEDLKEQIEVEEINNLNLDTTTPSFNTLKVKIYGELLARAVALDDEVSKERIMDLYSKTLSSFGSGLGASSNDIMSNIKILDEIDYKVKQEQEVLLNLRTASGKTISDEISDIISGLSKDVSDLINKALNETDSKINKAVNDIVAENEKETEPKKTFIPKDKKGKELIKSAFDELKKLYGGGNKLSFALDPKREAEEQLKVHKKTVQLLVQIGKGLIQEGVATIQNISDKIRDYIGRELGNAINFDDFKNEVLEKLNKQNKEKSIKSSNSEKLAEAIYNHNNKKDKPNKDKDIKEKIAEALILKYKADNKQTKPKSNKEILKEVAERVLNNDIADKLWDEAYIIASNKIDSDINLSEEEKQSQKDDLKEYIAKSKGSPFRDSEVREIVRNKFATDKDALRVKIRELAVSHFDDVNAEADSFVSRLMDETGLSYNQAETLFNAIKNEVKEIVARKAEQSLKAKDKRINDAKNNSKVKAEKPKTKIDNIVNDILRFGNIPQSRQGNYTSVLQHYGIPISNATAIRNLQQLAVIINSTSGVTQQNAQVVFQQILGQLEESPLARSKVFWNTLQNGFLANILGRGSVAIKSLFSTYIAGNWFRLQQSIVDLFSNYNGKVGLTDRVRFAFGNQRINKKVLDKLKNGFTDENGNFVMPSNQSQRSTNVLSRIANLFDVILRGNPQAKVWYEEADGMVEKELGSVFKDWKFSNALKKIYTLSMAMPVMLVRSLGAGDLFVREGVYNAQLSRIKGKEILKSGVKYGSKEYYEKLLVSLVQTEEVQNEITDIINKEEQALNRAGITMSEADKRRRRRELEAEKIGVESEVARIREEESIIAGMVSPMSEGLIKMLMTIQLAEFQKKIEGKRPDEIKASTIAIYNTLRLWNLFAKTLVPIVNIVTKSYIYGLKHVPIVGVGVHFTDKKVAQMIQKENYIEDKSDVSRMFVRQMLGLGMSSMLMSLLFEGADDDEEEDGTLLNLQNKDVIFWGGYDKELAQNYPDKFRPNSLYYKGKLISFRDNPITLLLYPIGQITNSITKRDMYKNNPNSDGTPSDKYLQEREKTKGNGIERYIKSVLWNVPLYFKEMGTMQGIRDVLDILMGDEDWKIERAINKVTTAPFKATPLHSGLYTDIIDMQEEKSDYASSKDFTQNWSNYLVQNSVFQNATKIPDKLDILGNKIYKQYDLSPIVTDFDFMFSYKELPKEMKDVYDYASKNNIYLGGRSIKGYFNYEVKEAMKKEETAKLLKDLYKKTEGNIPNDANFENAVKVLLRNELKVRYGKFLEEYVKNKQYENLPIEMQQENVLSALKDIKDMVWIEKGISTD
jgi:tRNA threonylcarbamoyladenosine modification (KEOPS) complex  Pcc1 subunit